MATNSVEEENKERVRKLLLADGFQFVPWEKGLAVSKWGHTFLFYFVADSVNVVYPSFALCKSGDPTESLLKEAVNLMNSERRFCNAYYWGPDEDGDICFHRQSSFFLRPANMSDGCLKEILDELIGFIASTPQEFNEYFQQVKQMSGNDTTHITGFAAPTPKPEDGSGNETEPQPAEPAEETTKATSRPIGFAAYAK